jgi:shikimate dehydrogenase
MITGNTSLIAHIGFPTFTFKSPMIYNPYFEAAGIDTVVVPFACESAAYPEFLPALFKVGNIKGALITMPHKVATLALLDQISPSATIAGSCNAVRRTRDGKLQGDMFDGEGFVRGLVRKGLALSGRSALIIGSGGVGSAIAASLARVGVKRLGLYDLRAVSCKGLAERIRTYYPQVELTLASPDPTGYDLVVNASPMGMNENDPMPVQMDKLSPDTFVGEVVLRTEMTSFLRSAQARGCRVQIGADMLFEQIPAYLEFFDLPTTSPEHLRQLSKLD